MLLANIPLIPAEARIRRPKRLPYSRLRIATGSHSVAFEERNRIIFTGNQQEGQAGLINFTLSWDERVSSPYWLDRRRSGPSLDLYSEQEYT